MLRKCIYGECAHEQHVRRTLTITLTHTITAYSVSGNVVRVRILICATDKSRVEKEFTNYQSQISIDGSQEARKETAPLFLSDFMQFLARVVRLRYC